MISNREKAIEKLITETQNDPDNIALILIGSSATGETKEYSESEIILLGSVFESFFQFVSAEELYKEGIESYPDTQLMYELLLTGITANGIPAQAIQQ